MWSNIESKKIDSNYFFMSLKSFQFIANYKKFSKEVKKLEDKLECKFNEYMKSIINKKCPRCGSKLEDKKSDSYLIWICPNCTFSFYFSLHSYKIDAYKELSKNGKLKVAYFNYKKVEEKFMSLKYLKPKLKD